MRIGDRVACRYGDIDFEGRVSGYSSGYTVVRVDPPIEHNGTLRDEFAFAPWESKQIRVLEKGAHCRIRCWQGHVYAVKE